MNRWVTVALSIGFITVILPVYALRPGNPAQELNLKWVQGTGISGLPASGAKTKILNVVVFLQTRASNCDESLNLLNNLHENYLKGVRIAVAAPDSVEDVQAMLKRRPDFRLSVGVDQERKITATYMSGSILYPMAFVIDDSGSILWNGELVDLEEMIRSYLDGSFDLERQKKLAPLMDELQTLLRQVNDRRLKNVVDSILKIDPGNAAALRIRLFALESTGRLEEAWQLIDSQIKGRPTLARLYFAALDLASRYPTASERIPTLLNDYSVSILDDPRSDNLMAWTLLSRFQNDTNALRTAVTLAKRAEMQLKKDAPIGLRASVLSTRSLVSYRLGKVSDAIRLEQEALELWKKAQMFGYVASSQGRLEYYRVVMALSEE